MKPWDDETDMAKLEECVRSIQADGLVWGSSKLVLVGYGIKKLQIQCVVEDDKVGTDMLAGADHCFCRVCTVYGCGCIQQDLKSIMDQYPQIKV